MRAPVIAFAAFAVSAAAAVPASADVLYRSVDVRGDPAQVWAAIGPFCAIADWHPAIRSCVEDGKSPPTRTLKTRDGAVFVELQTARGAGVYAYTFRSSPLPVTGYTATIRVAAKAKGVSTVSWRGVYTPDPGQAKAAEAALSGIYESGLASIKAKLEP